MTEKNDELDTELVQQLVSTLRETVANQQIEIIDLRASLIVAQSRLEKIQSKEQSGE